MSDENNIIQFPVTDKGDDQPISLEISATPEQLLPFCLGRLLRLEASVHALSICIGGDLASILTILDREAVPPEEFVESYRQTRRAALRGLVSEMQEQFPVKKN